MRFSIENPLANRVCLAGDFNEWDPNALTLTRNADGLWSTSLLLKPGTYEYLFVVDGIWQADPCADKVSNPYGSVNSVVYVLNSAEKDLGKNAGKSGVDRVLPSQPFERDFVR